MAITQERTLDSPRKEPAAPDGEHSVLEDLLAEGTLTDDEEDLREHNPAVQPARGYRDQSQFGRASQILHHQRIDGAAG